MKWLTILTAYEPTLLTLGLDRDPDKFWPLFWQYNACLFGLGALLLAVERHDLLPPRRAGAAVDGSSVQPLHGTFLATPTNRSSCAASSSRSPPNAAVKSRHPLQRRVLAERLARRHPRQYALYSCGRVSHR